MSSTIMQELRLLLIQFMSKCFFFSDGHEYYELMIKYFGPGSNLCVHRSTDEAGIWDCTGAY
ncbi:hypothetical protein OR60_22570 [Xanthomonas vesicatoria]|uniref:Uncharacterized protein n=1 Tax=Xanthomonas vesicatoria TaxID=56460 RepID=A0AAJ0N2M1_9XANT|nr:hypothetical protein OR60_22570 [Xanthomonas vesicatoria]KHM91326.1 hypothetical protein OR61_19395 [Xanthomonas vesicatoria]